MNITGSRKLIAYSAALACVGALVVTGKPIPPEAFLCIAGLFAAFSGGNGLEWLGRAKALGRDAAEESDNEEA